MRFKYILIILYLNLLNICNSQLFIGERSSITFLAGALTVNSDGNFTYYNRYGGELFSVDMDSSVTGTVFELEFAHNTIDNEDFWLGLTSFMSAGMLTDTYLSFSGHDSDGYSLTGTDELTVGTHYNLSIGFSIYKKIIYDFLAPHIGIQQNFDSLGTHFSTVFTYGTTLFGVNFTHHIQFDSDIPNIYEFTVGYQPWDIESLKFSLSLSLSDTINVSDFKVNMPAGGGDYAIGDVKMGTTQILVGVSYIFN
jgi:hypothetical protein